ncbi:MAG: discoidin domain-containing protein, partial [Planctomycetota bacterium]
MCKKLIYLATVVVVIAATGPLCWATVGPVTSVTTDNPPGSPPYNILSITVGSYTIGGTPRPGMDDFDINTAVNYNTVSGGGGNYWTINFGGGLWKNSNGDDPDFFLFESGGEGGDDPDIAPVFPDGTVGTVIDIPGSNWGPTGYNRDAAAANDGMDMNGQEAHGLAFAITDLLDAAGNPLSNDTAILGLWISDRGGADPVGFFAVTPPPVLAVNPDPANEATDVPRDVILGWEPGQTAQTHDVYFGTVFNDVNEASRTDPRNVLARQGQTAIAHDPDGLLDFGQTYYWRVDEVEADGTTVHRGDIWSFTAEPVGYPIDGTHITATASSMSEASFGPEKTIDGSGLDENGLHSLEPTDMWLSGNEPLGAWIQYELDKAYKLREMWVWNSNQIFESLFGFGMRDVTVEYSTDGAEWAALAGVPEFAQAPGTNDYAHDTTVDFGGVLAQYVRLTATSGWGGVLPQYGLSEVRFFSIPVSAREPSPESGATDVDVDATLSWRAGREAATHDVSLSTDEQAVIDGTAPVVTVADASYSSALDLGSTYYWRIDEVNEAETPTT